MELRQLFDPTSSTYTYLLWEKASRQAALVDSVQAQIERDSGLVRELDLELKYLLETHIHADHITSAGELRNRFCAKTVLHRNSHADCADILVDGGERLMLGGQVIQVIFTPGHTDTDVCYLFDGAVLTGDTLLIRGTGRTDFQSGDAGTLYDSITGTLFRLSNDTLVYPAHDYNGCTVSTIGEERVFNPRLREPTPRGDYIRLMESLVLDRPKLIDTAIPENLACGLKRQDRGSTIPLK